VIDVVESYLAIRKVDYRHTSTTRPLYLSIINIKHPFVRSHPWISSISYKTHLIHSRRLQLWTIGSLETADDMELFADHRAVHPDISINSDYEFASIKRKW